MDPIVFGQLNEAYHRGVYGQENLSEEEYLDIQEWVEALIDEGYDLDQYSDDELYEAYLADLKEAKVDSNLTPLQKIRKRNQDPSLVMPVGQQTAERRAYHEGGRGVKKEKGKKSAFGTMRHIGGPYKEELDLYDLVSEYLVSEGFCDSYEDADVIMANMSEEWREGIVEEVLDEANRNIGREILQKLRSKKSENMSPGERRLAHIKGLQQRFGPNTPIKGKVPVRSRGGRKDPSGAGDRPIRELPTA